MNILQVSKLIITKKTDGKMYIERKKVWKSGKYRSEGDNKNLIIYYISITYSHLLVGTSMELHGVSSGIILYSVAVIPVRRLKNLHSELSETNSNSLAIIFSDLLV